MNNSDQNVLQTFVVLVVIPGLCTLFAFACGQGGKEVAGIPLFVWSVGLVFAIQWLAFIPAYWLQTERFFDLTGSITYLLVIAFALAFNPGIDTRRLFLAIMVTIWAVRLGTFLFSRIKKAGKDDRFDAFKSHFFRFLTVWTIQGMWITFTIAAALTAMTTTLRKGPDLWGGAGLFLWLCGFFLEAVADWQKIRFRANPQNRDRFIHTGLWALSRHPNYFGEIVLWIGIAFVAFPVLAGWQRLALGSPVFVYLLLTRISGIPLLEKKADKKWGGREEYEIYKKTTPVLLPAILRKFGR
jgi:steroid 5-alpha reductase family enzyme